MKLYQIKKRSKWMLLLLASVIVAGSLWYSNTLISQIKKEERNKVKLWSEAIQKKAKLVNYTNKLFDLIRDEEQVKIELWGQAMRKTLTADFEEDLTFYLSVLTNNTTIPLILVNNNGVISDWNNIDGVPNKKYSTLDSAELAMLQQELDLMRKQNKPIIMNIYAGLTKFIYFRDSKVTQELKIVFDELINDFITETVINTASMPVVYVNQQNELIAFGNLDSTYVANDESLKLQLTQMAEVNQPIEIKFDNQEPQYIYYEDSLVLIRLRYYPYIQFGIIGLFLALAYIMFSGFRNAEQNQVWVGMSKETAHQLGTPLSSMMAWVDVLAADERNADVAQELGKDVKRLEMITERFSKIGSAPKLAMHNMVSVVQEAIDYLKPRVSSKITFKVEHDTDEVAALISKPLFEWAFENICKNAIDAMNGEGAFTVSIKNKEVGQVIIDLTDTGKGISPAKQKTVFEPGYTTKSRGWGLGLSLTKRIIQNYHSGKVFVLKSEPGKGTTFRIWLLS
jgi:two-component system, sporulation sensor kinase D